MNGICIACLGITASAAWPCDADDRALIEMLRAAQVTNRAALRQGRVTVRLRIDRDRAAGPVVLDGEVAWNEADFHLKFKVSDPHRTYSSMKLFGDDWNYIQRTRDFVQTYNSAGGVYLRRQAEPGAFDAVLLDLNPWTNASTCCPPNASPPSGRPWPQMIGPHPAMKEIAETSTFSFETLPGGDVKQVRRDDDGSLNEIVFAKEFSYAVASLRQRDPRGAVVESADCRYQKRGRAVLPVEARFVMAVPEAGPATTFTYTYSNWDVDRPPPPSTLSVDQFKRMALGLREKAVGAAPSRGSTGIGEAKLLELSRELSGRGFGAP